MDKLYAAEIAAFSKVKIFCKDKPILDIGVGGGRTTLPLLEISKDYLGIDYAKGMIDACKQKYPDLNFMIADARNLRFLPNSKFSLVVFSFNGIDYVSHKDRLAILGEVNRVLVKGGYFVFSTHNSAYDRRLNQPPLRRLIGRIKDAIYPSGRKRRHIAGSCSYEYRDEPLYSTGKMLETYYINSQAQIDQLKGCGFTCDQVIDHDGATIGRFGDKLCPWLYFVTQKYTDITVQDISG